MPSSKSILFNSKFDRLGQDRVFGKPNLSRIELDALQAAQKEVTSEFCEELLLFDKVSLKADRINYSLYFLIREFGVDTIQEYLERGLIEFLLWTPLIVTSTGSMREDGTIDRDSVIGKPPLVSGQLFDRDKDPEYNVEKILKQFYLSKDRIRSFKKAAAKSTIIPNTALASQAVELTVDAYITGKLSGLGFEYTKKPENLNVDERLRLMGLGQDVLETSILAEYEYKSLNDYSYTEISDKALTSIGSALNINDGIREILTIENIPDLKSLFLSGQLNKDDVKALRYKSSAKAFRKWLNNVSTDEDCLSITKEYLNEIAGKNNFWNTAKGKVVKTVSIVGVGSALGAAIGGLTIASATAGVVATKIAELGLGLFDSMLLDNLLKGKNLKMFIDEIEKKIHEKASDEK